MAKKVILKDQDNVEILPITRGELIVDSSGKEAFHSNEFLATNSQPGLMSPEEKAKLSTMAGNTIDSTLSTTSVNPVQNKVVTVAINEAKQLANDAQETANDASENVSRVQQIINSIKESYLKSATVNGNVLTIVDQSDSEITFTNTIYNTFLKETAANTGGRNGLVPKPNYNDGSKTRFLREDGTWVVPTDTKNTAGSTNSTSKLFLIGATSQAANPQTYSNSSVYTTNGTLYATTFVGNLDGTYVNKLTGYKIAEAIGSISATDSLNTALGKLEFKTDFIYNDLFGTNNDDVINKWHEIVDFVDSVAEGTDITDEFVTRKTAQTITGVKTFSTQQKFTVADGTSPFTVASTTQVTNLNADLLDGFHVNTGSSGKCFGKIPVIGADGVTELGHCIDWHYDNTTTSDYSTRLQVSGNHGNTVNLPSASGTLALTSQIPTVTNYYWADIPVQSASDPNTRPTFGLVTTPRIEVGNCIFMNYSGEGIYLNNNGLHWHVNRSYQTNLLNFTSTGNVGVGTSSPDYRLHVNGNVFSTGFVKSNSSDSYVLLGGGGHKALSDFAMSSDYVKKAGDTMTGNLTMSTGVAIHLWDDSATTSHRLSLRCASDVGRIYNYTGSAYGAMYIGHDGTNAIVITSGQNVGIGTGTPSSKLHVNGGLLNITHNSGTLTIGSQNTSYTHYSTTGGTHWFNKDVEVNGNHSPHANNSFSSGTSSKRWSNVYSVLGNFTGNVTLYSASGDSPHLYFQRGTTTDGTYDWDMFVTGGSLTLRQNNAGTWNTALTAADNYMSTGWRFNVGKELSVKDQRFNYGLAYYNTSTSTVTGTIVITLPNGWTDAMNTYEIDIYEYIGYSETTDNVQHSKLIIDGYNYSGGSAWINYGYTQIGSYNKGVRLGYNGSKCVIMLGTTSTTWSYPQVHLSRVITGYANQTAWSTGYSISVITSESGYSAIVTANRLRQRFADVVANTFRGTLSGNASSASTVTVNNSDANSTYRMVWHSGNTLYGTGGIYCNPSTDYLYATSMQASSWFRSTGNTGWYNPTNECHVYPNNISTYGGLILRGIKSSYHGFLLGTSTSYLTVMSTDVHHGLYAEGKGWEFYYNRTNHNVGLLTSTMTKAINLAGQTYISSNTWIGTTSGDEMLNVGGWVGTTGNTGWYNISYAGGMYMQDTTYVRTYNSKALYVSNTGQYAIYTAGGFASSLANGHILSTYYNGTWYTSIQTHGNGNLSISPPSGSLYLAYSYGNTYFGGGTYYINRSGYFNGTAAAANSVAWANVTDKPTIPTVYSRDIDVNGTNWTFYSSTSAATTSIYAPTSAGTSGYILQSSGGTPTWTARQDYSNPGILWVGYIYRSSRTSTFYYASKSGGKATFSLTSTPNLSYEYLSGKLSGYTSIMAAFVQTQAVFSDSSTTCYAYSSINFGKAQEAGFDTYRVSISGSTIYIRACRMTDSNNSSWEDDGFLCTDSGQDNDARPVARIYLMIIGY